MTLHSTYRELGTLGEYVGNELSQCLLDPKYLKFSDTHIPVLSPQFCTVSNLFYSQAVPPSVMRLQLAATLLGSILCFTSAGAVATERQCENARYDHKHKAFVLTDMSNEPDDQMSLVRLLTYSNEIDIRGIGVITSKESPYSVPLHPEQFRAN